MLTEIRIENYKSIEKIKIPLHPITVFVGPNNSGKSNTLDTFKFLSEWFNNREVTTSRGGFQSILWNGDLGRRLLFEMDSTVKVDKKEYPATYKLVVAGGTSNYFVTNEELYFRTSNEIRPVIKRDTNWCKAYVENFSEAPVGDYTNLSGAILYQVKANEHGATKLFLPICLYNTNLRLANSFCKSLMGLGFYDLVPKHMKDSTPIRSEYELKSEGENIWTTFDTIQRNRKLSQSIIEHIKVAIPEIDDITAVVPPQMPGNAYGTLLESHLSYNIPACNISHGVLRLLSMLLIAYNPSPPPLICIEEPENGLHQRRLEIVADILKMIGHRTQLLVTTHSPLLLNYISKRIGLECITVVEKKEGKTNCKPASDIPNITEVLKELGIGDVIFS